MRIVTDDLREFLRVHVSRSHRSLKGVWVIEQHGSYCNANVPIKLK